MKRLVAMAALAVGVCHLAQSFAQDRRSGAPPSTSREDILRVYEAYRTHNRGPLSRYAGLYDGEKGCGVELGDNRVVFSESMLWLYWFDDDVMTVYSVGPSKSERIKLEFFRTFDHTLDGEPVDRPLSVYRTSDNRTVGKYVGFDGVKVTVGLDLKSEKNRVSTNKFLYATRCSGESEKRLLTAVARNGSDCGKASGEASIAACTQLIRHELGDATVYYNRGNAYLETNDNDRAIADYDKAAQLDPKLAVAYVNRGTAYRSKGDLDRAIADYSRAIEVDPGQSIAYGNRGAAYKIKGDFRRALADYDKLIELSPEDASAFERRADIHEKLGDRAAALADWKRQLALLPAPHAATEYNERAWAYFKVGEAEKGLADVQQALKLSPGDANALDTRGSILEALGRRKEAIADFRKALSIDPSLQSSKDALLRLGARK